MQKKRAQTLTEDVEHTERNNFFFCFFVVSAIVCARERHSTCCVCSVYRRVVVAVVFFRYEMLLGSVYPGRRVNSMSVS